MVRNRVSQFRIFALAPPGFLGKSSMILQDLLVRCLDIPTKILEESGKDRGRKSRTSNVRKIAGWERQIFHSHDKLFQLFKIINKKSALNLVFEQFFTVCNSTIAFRISCHYQFISTPKQNTKLVMFPEKTSEKPNCPMGPQH